VIAAETATSRRIKVAAANKHWQQETQYGPITCMLPVFKQMSTINMAPLFVRISALARGDGILSLITVPDF
jgi:hypothetical protein